MPTQCDSYLYCGARHATQAYATWSKAFCYLLL
jgi:hypothetical protein